MKLYADSNAIHFKCDPGYFAAVKRGVKTAEVRILSRQEWSETQIENPTLMYLTEPTTNETLTRHIGYISSIGTFVGSFIVLFCFARAEEGSKP